MKRLNDLFKKIFFLPPLPTALIAIPSFTLVIYVLASGMNGSALCYFSYILSAYALILVSTGLARILQAMRQKDAMPALLKKTEAFHAVRRFREDIHFRTVCALSRGFLVNLLYIAVKLTAGIYYRSVWFLSLAVYYMLLAAMRFFLLRHANQNSAGQNFAAELRQYRLCGILLCLMNQALTVIVIFMVHQNRGYTYPGMLIYAMAAYAFYAVIISVINFIKYRNHASPVVSAAKGINLIAALISILSLETAMLARFGAAEDHAFRQTMTGATGGAVCAIVLAMAVFMIVRSSRQLKKLKNSTIQEAGTPSAVKYDNKF